MQGVSALSDQNPWGVKPADWNRAPKDLLWLFFRYLEANEVCALGQTCKLFQQVSLDERVWKPLIIRDFPEARSSREVYRQEALVRKTKGFDFNLDWMFDGWELALPFVVAVWLTEEELWGWLERD